MVAAATLSPGALAAQAAVACLDRPRVPTTRVENLTSFIAHHRASAAGIFTRRREHRAWVKLAQKGNPGVGVFFGGNPLDLDVRMAKRHRRLVNQARRDLRVVLAGQRVAA